MGVPSWYPAGQTQPTFSRSAWDILKINDRTLPGRWKITRASAAWKMDTKKKPGADADRPTILGFDPRPVSFEGEVIQFSHAELVLEILAPYIPEPGGKGEPVNLSHVSIDHLKGVKRMQITEVSQWDLQNHKLKLRVSGMAWVGEEKPAKDGKPGKVRTHQRPAPSNKQREDADKKGLTGGQNPRPDEKKGFCGPTFTPSGGV